MIVYLIPRFTKENCFINIKYLTQTFLKKKKKHHYTCAFNYL